MKHPWENDTKDALERKEKEPACERESERLDTFQHFRHVSTCITGLASPARDILSRKK